MSRATLLAYANANFDSNGVQGITGAELNAYSTAIANEAMIRGEAGDIGSSFEWVTNVLQLKAGGVGLSNIASIGASTILGNNTGGAAAPIALTAAQAKTVLAIAIADVSGLQTALDAKANLTGATFTGGVTVNATLLANSLQVNAGSIILDRTGDASPAQFIARRDAGFAIDYSFQTGTSTRWVWRINNAAESGSDAGSNFQIINYSDAGAALSVPLTITRATGIVAFAASPTGPTPTAGDSTTKLATTAFVTTAIAAGFGANDAMLFKGVINASTNPNYPAADAGHTYRISVAGKIGGASGPNVEVGDLLVCLVDATSAGDHATVGANWSIVQANIDGAVVGPSSVTANNPVLFDGTSGRLIKETTYAAFKSSLAIAAADVTGLAAIASSGSASDLSTGTVPDARISGNYTGIGNLTMSGDLSIGGGDIIATANLVLRRNTADGADDGYVVVTGGGAFASNNDRGAYLQLYGNEAIGSGSAYLGAGPAGTIELLSITNAAFEFNAGGTIKTTGGDLHISRTGGSSAQLLMDADAGSLRQIIFRSGTSQRWQCFIDNDAEAGSNAGATFVINAYNDAGANIGRAIAINRADRNVKFGGGFLTLDQSSSMINKSNNTGALHLYGAIDSTVGAYLSLYGNSHATYPGRIFIQPGSGGSVSIGGDTTINPGDVVISAGNFSVSAGTFFLNRLASGQIIQCVCTENSATHGPSISLNRNTVGGANDEIGGVFAIGDNASSVSKTWAAWRNIIRTGTNGSEEIETQLQAITAGGLGARLLISGGLFHTAATGADKGNGSINMDACYDDGTLLTCIPLDKEFIETGIVNLEKWDALVPNQIWPAEYDPNPPPDGEPYKVLRPAYEKVRTHTTARLFKELIDSGCDPRKPETFFARMKDQEGIPGMPIKSEWEQSKFSLGQMVSRLWLVVDMMGVVMSGMYDKMQAAGIA
jgi:hypothetical protein